MAGLLSALQGQMGRVLNITHRVLGFQVDYTHASDTTVEGMVPIIFSGIFIQPTPLVKVLEITGLRRREIMSAAGNLSAQALPIFLVSREALREANGTYRTPGFHDTFVETGTTTPTFHIKQITEVAAVTPGWFLTVSTVFRDEAPGHF